MEQDALAEFFGRPPHDYLSGLALTLAHTKIVLAADSESIAEELDHYVVRCSDGEAHSEYTVFFSVNPGAVESLRQRAKRGLIVYAKPDYSYRVAMCGNCFIYADELGFESRHAIVKRGRQIHIVVANEGRSELQLPLRVIREIVLREAENTGGVFAHAAACSDEEGRVVLFVGPSGSGKTTSLLWFLKEMGGRFLTNDKAILFGDPKPHICPLPFAIRVGAGTVMSLGDVGDINSRAYRRKQQTAFWNELINNDDDQRLWGSRNKLELTPSEMAQLLGIGISGGGNIALVVLTKLSLSDQPAEAQLISSDEAEPVLQEEIYGPIEPDFGRGWLGIRAISDDALLTAKQMIIQRLSALPLLQLRGDPRFALAKAVKVVAAGLS